MTEPDSEPLFPPLYNPVAVDGAIDPFDKAASLAALGCDGGTLVHGIMLDRFRAAIVFAPEVPLEDAMAMFCVCGVGFSNALGALAPPEVAVHLQWDGTIRVNGARCGGMRARASTTDPEAIPDWLVIGIEIPLIMASDSPGLTPDRTALLLEGCGDVDAVILLESWSRHTLVWINRWSDDGNQPLHAEWRGMAHGLGEEITLSIFGKMRSGMFLGVDERFGMLLRDETATHLLPLSTLLE